MVFSEPYFENRGRFLEAGPKEFSHPESRTKTSESYDYIAVIHIFLI